MRVIKNRQIVHDDWQFLPDDVALTDGDVIVSWARWSGERASLQGRGGRLGVRINGDDQLEAVVADLAHFDLIAVEFPAFVDGRGYSHARLLRQRYGYRGELRAVGDVLRDQLLFMSRCGFDSFELRQDRDPEDALAAFSEISVHYQSAADGAEPVYRRRSQ